MKKIISIILCVISINTFAQEKTVSDFKTEFEKIVNSDLTENQLNNLFSEYPLILTPHSENTQLFESLKGTDFNEYSMLGFKDEDLYKTNIDKLLNSENSNKRILAYLLVASTNDKSKEDILLQKIKSETNKGNLIWSGMALLSIQSNHTDEIFDFLVANENFGDAHMLPLYIQLDKDSIQHTAYKKINSENEKAKVLAVQSLSVTENNPVTEELVKNAVKNWDIKLKGYAIYTMKELQMGKLLELLRPLLNDDKTKRIALEALANSPTKEDNEYLIRILNDNTTLDSDILDALYKSKNIENLKLWLTLMQTRTIPNNYHFFIFEQPLLESDEILTDLQNALQNIKDKDVLGELVRALQGRADDKSVDLMIDLLKHPSSTVRYWAAETIKDNPNSKLKSKENIKLIKRGLRDEDNPD